MQDKTFAVVYMIYSQFCTWLDKNNIEDSYPEIQQVEDLIKAEGFTLFELDEKEYMEDKFAIWYEMFEEE